MVLTVDIENFVLKRKSQATVAIGAFRSVAERNRRKFALPCGVCKGKGFYLCKLCNGNATIKWSPLYDPIHINPCVCPTCDGCSVA
ncbi:hypothetical protein ES332_A05G020600v1 [Gossypium tomentosum]|uniref:Uncharacterized protein n=1 Tax=Gossypium tomentosum TaxID=34277 RepID=A0A5D2Q9R0_GOSTO|nr:hypothetical protein ES332_A05G020600v1 [Gossypium tomentosum]TYI24956.1 hypothetical protein ES332_A05G020600v1 [Gossypium tomentosum]TYI24958.1 hypothetical protein ES332_A05G020600v1 [Gossypium tomentosum]